MNDIIVFTYFPSSSKKISIFLFLAHNKKIEKKVFNKRKITTKEIDKKYHINYPIKKTMDIYQQQMYPWFIYHRRQFQCVIRRNNQTKEKEYVILNFRQKKVGTWKQTNSSCCYHFDYDEKIINGKRLQRCIATNGIYYNETFLGKWKESTQSVEYQQKRHLDGFYLKPLKKKSYFLKQTLC